MVFANEVRLVVQTTDRHGRTVVRRCIGVLGASAEVVTAPEQE